MLGLKLNKMKRMKLIRIMNRGWIDEDFVKSFLSEFLMKILLVTNVFYS